MGIVCGVANQPDSLRCLMALQNFVIIVIAVCGGIINTKIGISVQENLYSRHTVQVM